MLLLYSASDASGQGQGRCQRCNRHQDPQCRNLFLTQVLLPQWRLEFEDFDNGNSAAWQFFFDDWVIEQFWCPQVASLQVDLQIALKKVSRCWQPKQMRGWESRQLELDHVIWCDLIWWWSFGAKAPAVNPGFVQHCCDYAQILRRQHQTTMWVYQKCLTAQSHIFFSLTQPNMFIFRTHNLVQNPTSDPATIWWQSFQDQVPLANSGMLQSLDWRDHKSENGFEEAMHWFQTHRDCTKSYEIIEDLHDLQHFTTLQKFSQSEDVAPHEIRNESWPLLHSSPVVCFIRSASLASDCHGLCREVTPGWFGRSRRDGHSCLNCEYR